MPEAGPWPVSVFMSVASGISNSSGISSVVVVPVEMFDDAPGDANKEFTRIVVGVISPSISSSITTLSGELLGNDVDDDRREDDVGGGGNGFGNDDDADEVVMLLSKVGVRFAISYHAKGKKGIMLGIGCVPLLFL